MKRIKSVIATVFALMLASSLLASDISYRLTEAEESLREEIAQKFKSTNLSDLNPKESSVRIQFLINDKYEVIVLKTDNDELDSIVKASLNYKKVKTWKDFQSVPTINKDNYLRKYPYNELYWDGDLKDYLVYTSSSGSTGAPLYFARNNQIDWQHSVVSELFIRRRLSKKDTPILFINAFGIKSARFNNELLSPNGI